FFVFFFSSRRRHTRSKRDWSSDVCSSDLVDEDNKVHLHQVTCAVDSGYVINPATVKRQLEGGIVWALSSTFKNEITITDGRIDQANFNNYPMPHLADTPPIKTILIESEEKIGGEGESSVPPFAPALANSIFLATCDRIRSMPFDKEGYSLA